jgi:hypothetical protein
MTMKRSLTMAAASALVLFVAAPLVHAQATRTWVSGVGDDANPCSRTAPCKTFAGAISKTAPAGEINTLDPGGLGAVTITRSMTIDATAGLGGVLAAGTYGVVVNAGAADVVILRNLDVNGAGTGLTGIRILAAGDVYVENCRIFGFTRRGISDERTSGRLFLTDVAISGNTTAGIGAAAASNTLSVTGQRVHLLRNANAGLNLGGGAYAILSDSVISGNVNYGVFATGTGTQVDIENGVASANGSGIVAAAGAVVRLSNTTVAGNGTGLNAAGGSIDSYGNNRIDGNAAGNGPPSGTVPLQ